MQNLPITAIPTASLVQQNVSTDNSATQAAEPFSNVLARQRANNASTPNTGAQRSKQAAPSSTGNTPPASGNEQSAELQAPAPDTVSTLPGSLLPAELLLVTSATDSTASSEKTDQLAPTPDAVIALSGNIPAALAPASAATNSATPNKKDHLRESASGEASTLPGDMLATLISSPLALQERSAALRPQPVATIAITAAAATTAATAANGGAGRLMQSANLQDAPSLSRTQSNTGSAAMASATAQGSPFSSALEAMDKNVGKNGALAAQMGASAMEFSAPATQPDPAANPAISTQNVTAFIAASPSGSVHAAINTPVAHDSWGDEFSQKITWLSTQHVQSAELHLNPPQLGPLDVVINVSGDQATALFTSPHAAVRDAVEQALPRLREMLAENGIMLGNAMVSDHSPKEQQAWLADQQQNGRNNLPGNTRDIAAVDGAPVGGAILPVRRQQGMVDTFA